MKVIRIAGIVLIALVLVVVAGLFAASLKASSRRSEQYESHRIDVPVPFPLGETELASLRAERPAAEGGGDPLAGVDLAALAEERARERGRHYVEARYGCSACHGGNLGGGLMLDDPAIGTLHGPNLTRGRGGVVEGYTMADWDRIVRHGIKRDGSPALMPSEDYFAMSDRELSDIVAYIRSLPPIDAEVPQSTLGPVGNVLIAIGKLPLSAEKLPDHQRAHAQEPPLAADTAEFGAHLAATCTGCHRSNLSGGPMPFGPPNWPAAANLTLHETGLASWSYEDFDKAMTAGVSKDGRTLREPMTHVLPSTRAMTGTERKAIWTYLCSLPPAPMNP